MSTWKYDPPGPPVPHPGCRKTAVRFLAVVGILAAFAAGGDTALAVHALAVHAVHRHQAHHALFRAVSLS